MAMPERRGSQSNFSIAESIEINRTQSNDWNLITVDSKFNENSILLRKAQKHLANESNDNRIFTFFS